MGLGPRFCVFSSYGSLLCILHFVVRSFVSTLIICFFFSCCLVWCFSFIYLFNKLGCNKWIIGGQNGRHQFFFLIFINSLFSFPRNKQWAATKHLKTRQLFIVFHSSHFSKQTRVFTYPTHCLTGAPPTRKHTSLSLKSFIYLLVWVLNDVGIEEL